MKDYHINLFFSEEDKSWIADIPDLAHRSAFWATPMEVLRVNVTAKGLKRPAGEISPIW